MQKKFFFRVIICALSAFFSTIASGDSGCVNPLIPQISFIEFQSVDLQQSPPAPLTVKGKLKLPIRYSWQHNCFRVLENAPAVVILHGSAGVDFRGDFHARALNVLGVASLEVVMFEALGVAGGLARPPLPFFNYPYAFDALKFLSAHANINPDRIGVLGFSWGAVVTMAAAETAYASMFGGDLRFKAHVANSPICYAYNNDALAAAVGGPGATSLSLGLQFQNLTGAPVMMQVGTEDDYDNGAGHCQALAQEVNATNGELATAKAIAGAYHGWSRLETPIVVNDPFADEGSVFTTGQIPEVEIRPNVERAYESRANAVWFLKQNL